MFQNKMHVFVARWTTALAMVCQLIRSFPFKQDARVCSPLNHNFSDGVLTYDSFISLSFTIIPASSYVKNSLSGAVWV